MKGVKASLRLKALIALVLLSLASPTVPQASLLTEELFVRFGIQSDKITVHKFHKSYPKVFKSAGVEINSKIKILEIGYSRGNSIPLWENMFPNAEIVSVARASLDLEWMA